MRLLRRIHLAMESDIDQPLGWKSRGGKLVTPAGKVQREGEPIPQNVVRDWRNPSKPYAENARRFLGLLESDDDFFGTMKELAKTDVSVLKNLVNLQKLYQGDDPQLSGKESQLAAGVVLQKLYGKSPKAAYYLGRMDWQPNLVNWMGFFDQVGGQTLAQFLGINSMEEIPIGQASGDGEEIGGDAAEPDLDGGDLDPGAGDDDIDPDAGGDGMPGGDEGDDEGESPLAAALSDSHRHARRLGEDIGDEITVSCSECGETSTLEDVRRYHSVFYLPNGSAVRFGADTTQEKLDGLDLVCELCQEDREERRGG